MAIRLGILAVLTPVVVSSLVDGTVGKLNDRLALTERNVHVVRHKMDIELPKLPSKESRLALASAEEFAVQRRFREALTQYLRARSLSPHPALHFLVGISCAKLGLYQHAEVALMKCVGMLEDLPRDERNLSVNTRLEAASLLLLSNLAFQASNKPHPELAASLQRAAGAPVFTTSQKSYLLSGLAALLSVDASKPKQAEEPALEAHKLDETNPIALHVLGIVHMRRFVFARAREWLRKAVAIDDHPMHHKLLVKCVWSQFEKFEGVRDKDKSTQAYMELTTAYPDSPIISMALVMSYANSKKYYSALMESNRTLGLFLFPKDEVPKWRTSDELVVELLSVRLVCLVLHGSYVTAVREMLQYTDLNHPVTAATVTVFTVCGLIIVMLTLIFGWEGSIIGTFGLVLLVLRGVLTMLLLFTITSTYQSMAGEPFPVPGALSVM